MYFGVKVHNLLKILIALIVYGGVLLTLAAIALSYFNIRILYPIYHRRSDESLNFTSYIKQTVFNESEIELTQQIARQLLNGDLNNTEYKVWALDQLSAIMQTKLKASVEKANSDCSQPTLRCGHQDGCGFGCQIHHRIACVLLSHTLGIPLIHWVGGWPYSKKWEDAFYPIGSSSCSPGPNTLTVRWRRKKTELFIDGNFSRLAQMRGCKVNCSTIEYPFHNGILVPQLIGDLIDILHEDPFVWWMGQFTKYVLRLRPNESDIIQKYRESLNFGNGSSMIGMHIRRTDKSSEAKLLPTENYFQKAKTLPNYNNKSSQTVFIASDASHEVIEESRNKYSSSAWNIIGFTNQSTIKVQNQRKNVLDEIIRDVYLLSECDYVICTMSSQVCRIILELMSSKRMDSSTRVKSLDNPYGFGLCCGYAVPPNVVKF